MRNSQELAAARWMRSLFVILSLFTLLIAGCSSDSDNGVSSDDPVDPGPDQATRPEKMVGLDREIVCERDFGDPAKSPYVIPFPVGASHICTHTYCDDLGGHEKTFAYDFDMAVGDTVVAAREGVIITAVDNFRDGIDINPGQNNQVFILHEDSTVAWYAHLQQNSLMANEGDTVDLGQPIALSGNTGNTGGIPHLHFQLFWDSTSWSRQNSIPVNFCNTNAFLDNNRALKVGVRYHSKVVQ